MPDLPVKPLASRDHGGNLSEAMARYGGRTGDWLDLSTGINPRACPLPAFDDGAFTRLPDAARLSALIASARDCYGVPDRAGVVAAGGASALIRQIPRLADPGIVAIPGPTYNEHAAAFRAEGWQVVERPGPGVTAAVIVNPNNPDGRIWSPGELALMARAMDWLVVDESFMDPTPDGSVLPQAGGDGLIVLRSFGKFYGLAGLRLGFAVTGPQTAARLTDWLGPWAVSGPAIEAGIAALDDLDWHRAETARLHADSARLLALGQGAGWQSVGGCALFQTFQTDDAAAVQDLLARAHIWSRIFPYAPGWLRLGLPGDAAGWDRLARALA